jgi:hypothetical protein
MATYMRVVSRHDAMSFRDYRETKRLKCLI